MILPFNKIGFSVKEKKEKDLQIKSKRYFYLSPNEKRLYFTHNEKMLKSALYSSENEEEVLNKLKVQTCKCMKIDDNASVEKLKELSKNIHPTISTKFCFEFKNNSKSWLIFSFFEEEISTLRDNFKKTVEKTDTLSQLPILPLLMPHTCNNKEIIFKFKQKYKIIFESNLFTNEPSKVLFPSENGTELMELSNGSKFTGEVLDGFPHGTGSEFREDGVTYKGSFFKGRWHGEGMIFMPSLEYWEGNFLNGFPVSL